MKMVGQAAVGVALVGLVIAYGLYRKVVGIPITDKKVAEITQEIQDGAMAFLKAEYRMLAMFVTVVAVALYFGG
ncbi:MAG TPA: hypothetical protein EYO98_05485, partial [Candidatus Poseidoniales archaeon]|nr:hypothetical protein [Candidatus Poseidoniales archaeon]